MGEKPFNLAIVAGAWGHFGGITTYVYHLVQGLEAHGVEYNIIPCGTVCKHWTSLLNFSSEEYLQDADAVLVVHFYPDFYALDHQRHMMGRIKKSGKPVFVALFSPDEWKWNGATECLQFLKPLQILFCGEQSRELFHLVHKDWISRARLEVFGLPYKRWNDREQPKNGRAICTSRIAEDKRIEAVLEAGGVEIWSGQPAPNSIYFLERFGGKVENIPEFKGGFEFALQDFDRVYGSASSLVDMTRIDGEGGRVQYTFLEAMDYDLSILCAADWRVARERSEFLPGEHYTPVMTPDEIRKGIKAARRGGNPHRDAHRVLLKAHDAAKVAGEILESWRKKL
jgi:hypothetical protein